MGNSAKQQDFFKIKRTVGIFLLFAKILLAGGRLENSSIEFFPFDDDDDFDEMKEFEIGEIKEAAVDVAPTISNSQKFSAFFPFSFSPLLHSSWNKQKHHFPKD